MKLRKILIIAIIFVVLLAALLSWLFVRTPRTTEMGSLTFEELCKNNGDQWMEMEETRKGKPISNTMCFGCMIVDNHFCNVNDYIEYVKDLPAFVR